MSEFGLHRISPNQPTTGGKWGGTSSRHPIDHLFNLRVLDTHPNVRVDHDVTISDHFPIRLDLLLLPSSLSALAKTFIFAFPDLLSLPSFPPVSSLLHGGSEAARRWLQEAYNFVIPSKIVWPLEPRVPKRPEPPRKYSALTAAQRSLKHSRHSRSPTTVMVRALFRKLHSHQPPLKPSWDFEHLECVLRERVSACLRTAHELLMKKLKHVSTRWTPANRAIHKFVRNTFPPKVSALDLPEGPTNDPNRMAPALV